MSQHVIINCGSHKEGYFWSDSLTLAAKRKSCSKQSISMCLEDIVATEFNEMCLY
jgi:hypothetical protein